MPIRDAIVGRGLDLDAAGGLEATRRARAPRAEDSLESMFPGDSEMARRMRSFDWSQNPLGPPERWPQNLKTSVRITLTSRHPMFVWWGERLINVYNDGYAAFLCAKHPAALGQPARTVWPEIWDEIGPRAAFAMHRSEGTYDEALPFVLLRKGFPEETYVTFSYSPIPDDDGGFGGILCPVTEETERIIGERQMGLLRELGARTGDARTSEVACKLAASALETNPADLPFALIYLIDRGKRSAWLAEAAGILRGASAAPEAVALDAPSLWPLEEVSRTHRACLVTSLAAVANELPIARGHRVTRAVAMPIAPAGGARTAGVLVVGLSPLRVFDDRYRQFLDLVATGISSAIANAEAYEAERRRAEALAEIDRAKSTFFGNVSHEFRTPLTLMLGPLEDALARDDLEPERREQLTLAHRNALRMSKLVNTLLDFSSLEAGRIHASYEPADLPRATAELASLFRSAVERAGLRFEVDCRPIAGPTFVDREMWEKIVLNLLSNALKFTFSGEIVVGLREEGGRVLLSVCDTGTGIPAEELSRVFERFHRVQGARARSHEGSGIGLALVHDLVKLHGGVVTVESTTGVGTTFTVAIPLGAAHLPRAPTGAARELPGVAVRAAPFVEEALRWIPGRADGVGDASGVAASMRASRGSAPAAIPERFRHARVLLADDNADLREYVTSLLSPWFDVEAVTNGEEALDACRRRAPDVLLSDVMMPAMDGFALLGAVRRDRALHTIPVILVSARAGDESKVEGLERGADDYLVKPFSARELLARVRAHLELAELRTEIAKERTAREEAKRLLVAELQHRARNLLAIVRAMAGETVRSSGSLSEVELKLDQRLAALARVYALLSRDDSGEVAVRELVQMELSAIAPGAQARITVGGPAVKLPHRAVQTVSLALHELATNALKYGALRGRNGRLSVRWRLRRSRDRGPWLRLDWQETGVRLDRAHEARRGFGRELIEQALPYELDAETHLEFGEGGVCCRIDLPVESGGVGRRARSGELR